MRSIYAALFPQKTRDSELRQAAIRKPEAHRKRVRSASSPPSQSPTAPGSGSEWKETAPRRRVFGVSTPAARQRNGSQDTPPPSPRPLTQDPPPSGSATEASTKPPVAAP